MRLHRNAKLGLQGRYALVVDIERGLSLREAARRRGVSPASAHRWWHRWSQADANERRTLSCLYDRSSRPKHAAAASDRYPATKSMVEVLEQRGFRIDKLRQPGNIHFEKYW